jgi:hypothetical protein
MAQLSVRPRRPASRILALPLGLCLGVLLASPDARAASPIPPAKASASLGSELATELALQPDAASAEAWLSRHIPAGTSLSDHPRFFAAAHEAYFDGEDSVLVFVYRSATPGRWTAWVTFDAERVGVLDTSASDL